MAMSVVEAMQLGLVPLVTPVGEIKNYCRDEVNAILIDDEDSSVKSILNLLDNKNAFEKIRQNTISYWNDSEIYSESIERASLSILNIKNAQNINT
jgi:glycosyltransferase involved in cell wall biosynthesis